MWSVGVQPSSDLADLAGQFVDRWHDFSNKPKTRKWRITLWYTRFWSSIPVTTLLIILLTRNSNTHLDDMPLYIYYIPHHDRSSIWYAPPTWDPQKMPAKIHQDEPWLQQKLRPKIPTRKVWQSPSPRDLASGSLWWASYSSWAPRSDRQVETNSMCLCFEHMYCTAL